MAHIHKSAATLRIMGENLIPAEITNLLGCEPTHEQTKGQVFTSKSSGSKRTAKAGIWRLQAKETTPENLDVQIEEIFNKLSSDLDVWESLKTEYDIDLFCGIFMSGSNEGMEISPSSLKLLGERGIKLGLDIYGPLEGEENA